MTKVTLGKVTVEVDSAKTKGIYSSIKTGSAQDCGCAYCRNFLAQIPQCFPEEVTNFFDQCGINPFKDAEVYEMGVAEGSDMHFYGGEYYFISNKHPECDEGKLSDGFQFVITYPSSLEPEEFRGVEGSKCFSFMFHIPWVLDESPD